MQIFAFILTALIFTGLLFGYGWLLKIEKVNTQDGILIMVMGQVMGLFIAMASKIFRIEQNQKPRSE